MIFRRFIDYRQLEESDCGLACIRMLARNYGMKISIRKLRSLCETSRLGISVGDILRVLKEAGMVPAAARVTMDEVWEMPLPAILFWDQKHFVVCYGIDKKREKFKIADPGAGKVTLSKEEFARHWTGKDERGIAILAAPSDDFDPMLFADEKKDFKLVGMLKDIVRKYRKRFMAIIAFTGFSLCADLAVPFLFQRTIDDGIQGKDINLVWLLILGQLFVFLGNYVTSNIVELLLTKLGLKVSIEMMNDYLNKLIRLPMSFFDRKVSSDLIQKANDQDRLKSFLVSTPTALFLTSLTLVIFSSLLVYFNYLIFLIFLGLTVFSIVWSVAFLRKRRQIDYTFFSYASDNRNALYELIYGMQEIKSGSAQDQRVGVWKETQKKINSLSIRSAMLNILIGSGTTFFIRLRDIAITGICATLVIQDHMTIGIMMTISYIVGRLSNPFSTIINSINTVQDASMSYERLSEILEKEHEKEPDGNPDKSSIELRNVWFKYPGSHSPFVIKGVDAVIPEGKVTAIVGNSGSGKTTLIKLMLGFYKPQEGVLLGGGIDLNYVSANRWLGKCGVVMQSGYIFSDTVLNNIALSDSAPDEKRAAEAAKMACIDEFIATLPMGYHTLLGEKGVELSGGQKQRMLIARAVYKDPEILFLDEATSSLDANNEKSIVENLRYFRQGRTVIIAAHRLSTVKDADNILYIEDGQVVESGTHEDLIAIKGKYHELVKNQLSLGA